MKRMFMIMMIAIAASSVALAQKKTSKDTNNSVETQLIALEKQAAEAWKNKNGNFYKSHFTDESVALMPTGTIGKSEIVSFISSADCQINSYSLDNFKVTMLNKDAAVLTYKGMQDVTCGGQKEPPVVWASTVYVKRGGKWQAAFHQETPAVQ
ncbi:MAG: nuclear transport factor 2 family protein [Acidobacteria bacterium]|nr:nuclear transport factor 2 family protein [Acidobacteriota bacterium]